MDCGIPFCHQGCPLGNIIPEWNDLVWRDDWDGAIERLHATNNFPEFTGRLCPAPCETACVLGINQDPVTIKNVEVAIIDRAWESALRAAAAAGVALGQDGRGDRLRPGRASPPPSSSPAPVTRSRSTSGPTRSAGCCATASPSSRWRRRSSTGGSTRCAARARSSAPASTSAATLTGDAAARPVRRGGARRSARRSAATCRCPGRELGGIHQAMEYLPQSNRASLGEEVTDQIRADGKHVVIIGGGDTGADCLGTAIRQGAASITQLEIMPQPPARTRPERPAVADVPDDFRVSSAHEEGGDRVYAVSTQEFLGDEHGQVRALRLVEVGRDVPADRGHRARDPGRAGAARDGLHRARSARAWSSSSASSSTSAATSPATRRTPRPSTGVFVAGDAGRGQSLIVWAIAEGRAAAAAVDRLPDRRDHPAGPDPADRASAHRLTPRS